MGNSREKAGGVTLMVLGALISDYGARLCESKDDPVLRTKVMAVGKAVQEVENWFKYNFHLTERDRQEFKTLFYKPEFVFIAEIAALLYGLPEANLEAIYEKLKEHIVTN